MTGAKAVATTGVDATVRYWVNTVSKDHTLVGRGGGFLQAGHGKAAPLARLNEGDWMVFYSPKVVYGEAAPCQRFTAVAQVGGAPYQVTMSESFKPFRKPARYLDVTEAPIQPLLGLLSFIPDRAHWGLPFRRGLFEISRDDFGRIAKAMALEENVT